MKRYLDLIPISAKRHRRQSLMTRLCIFLAVFLVTAIFGMADMELRSQRQQAIMDGAIGTLLSGTSQKNKPRALPPGQR